MNNEKNTYYHCYQHFYNHFKIKKQREMRNIDIKAKDDYEINYQIYKTPAVYKKLNNIKKIYNENDIFDKK